MSPQLKIGVCNCITVHFQPVGPISKEATEKRPSGFQYNIVLIFFLLELTATKDYIETSKEESSKKQADSSSAGIWQDLICQDFQSKIVKKIWFIFTVMVMG